MENITVIILNWNDSSTTINCVNFLKGIENIIVVDNGSEINDLSILKQKLPKNIKLLLNNKNLGFAEGNNAGIKYAIEKFNPKYILLLNNDAIASENFLNPLLSTIEKDPSIGAVQPKILKNLNTSPHLSTEYWAPRKEFENFLHLRGKTAEYSERWGNKSIIDSAGQIAYKYGSVRDRGINKPDNKEFQQKEEIFGACGAAVLYRVSALTDIGLFDKNLFCLFEDVDLSWKLRLKGYKTIYTPESIIYHERGISGKLTRKNKLIRRFYGFRNCLIVTLRYYPLWLILLFLPIHTYRLLTAFFYKIKYKLHIPLFTFVYNSIIERTIIQKNPAIKQIQKKWIV